MLHRNSLATLTDNWIVVRESESQKQVLLAIDSISSIKTFKTLKIHYVAWALGSLLIAAATAFSKQSDGATLPFALVSAALLLSAQATRQASLAFIAEGDTVRTTYGTLAEATTLVTAINSARGGRRWGHHPAYEFFTWWRIYFMLLVSI